MDNQRRKRQLDAMAYSVTSRSAERTLHKARKGIALSITCLVVALSGPSVNSLQGGNVRISFMDDDNIVEETLAFLRSAGCKEEAILSYKRALDQYYSTPLELDLGKFPPKINGFYEFDSPSRLVGALPHALQRTKHAAGINCFDLVILLAEGKLQTELKPDITSGPFSLVKPDEVGHHWFFPSATPRDFCASHDPPWYPDLTRNILPESMGDERECLSAALILTSILPSSTTHETLGSTVLYTLKWNWKRDELQFPNGYEVVLGHGVFFPERILETDHAGLLFRKLGRHLYLEKTGFLGPFVRLEFEDRSDLLVWLSGHCRETPKLGHTHHFVTFNNPEAGTIYQLETTHLSPQESNAPSAPPVPPATVAPASKNFGIWIGGLLLGGILLLAAYSKLKPAHASNSHPPANRLDGGTPPRE